jgi:ribosomal protein L11 methyltransferase
MKNNVDKTLIALTLFVPTEHSQDVAETLRTLTQTEPAIISKPQLKVDKVVTYLDPTTNISEIKTELKGLFPFSFRVQSYLLEESEWRDKWKSHYHPFKLTKRVKVVPSWNVSKKRSRLIEVILDPGYAFGTGLHETTQFMARMIERKRRRSSSLLDIGYGSGILSIVAAKLNYKEIMGIDNDENALSAAMENAKKNFVDGHIKFKNADLRSFNPVKKFDFIAANLDSASLLTWGKKLVEYMTEQGYLCISGITLENKKVVHNQFKKQGLRCIKKYVGKEWCGFLYKKKGKRFSRLAALRKKIRRH